MHKGKTLDEGERRLIGLMMPRLTENDRGFFLAAMSEYLGYGSAKEISELTGVTQQTISARKKELGDAPCDPASRRGADGDARIRAPGAGRKSAIEEDPSLLTALESLIEPYIAGNPMNFIRWTTRSTRNLQEDLELQGYFVSHKTIAKILSSKGFSLQQNKKYLKSADPGPDRDAQFRFIDSEARRFYDGGMPVVSVDAKKKEIVGNFKNNGKEWRPKGEPRLVSDHDFEGPLGKVTPYGVYDIFRDEGYVNVGIGPDTAEFAVNSICNWWFSHGQRTYPESKDVMIVADGGGSNGSRTHLWKAELQHLANISGLTFHVRHLPPGTSKWNKVEHRLFSFVSMNWRGVPLTSYELIVSLIGSTRTGSGTRVSCTLDEWCYETGRTISKRELEMLNITRSEWRGDWNYSIAPQRPWNDN